MIFETNNFIIYDSYNEFIEQNDQEIQKLKIWFDESYTKLMTLNSKGKQVKLTKIHCKNFTDEPDKMILEIKENTKTKFKVNKVNKGIDQKLQDLHDSICKKFNINPRDEHTPIRLICLLSHLAFKNITLEEFEKSVHQDKSKYKSIDVDLENISISELEKISEEQTDINQETIDNNYTTFYNVTTFYDNVIELIKNKNYDDILSQLKELKENFNLVLTQFRQYNGKRETNDTIETETILCRCISKIALKIIQKYNININSVVEYCGGMGNLSRDFKNYLTKQNIQTDNIKFDIIEIVDEVAKLNETYNMINDLKFNVINAPYIISKNYNIGLLNPPYNEKLLITDKKDLNSKDKRVLNFVLESIESTDITISFFPCSKISAIDDITTKIKNKILNISSIPIIIKLGDKLFPGIGAGQIVVVILINKRILKPEDLEMETRIFDFDTNQFIKKRIRQNLTWINNGENEFNQLVENLFNDKNKFIVNKLKLSASEDWLKCDNIYNILKKIDVNSSQYNSENTSKIKDKFNKLLEKTVLEEIILKISEDKNFDIEQFDKIYNDYKNIIKHNIKKIKLVDYFKILTGKSHDINKICVKNGKYNFISCTKFNNGIVGKCNCFDFDASMENPIYTLSSAGSIGYLFKQTVPFCRRHQVLCFEMIKQISNEDLNLIFISTQINNSGFNFNNKLTKQRLENLEIYIYDD